MSLEQFDGGPVRQKVEGVTQQDGLEARDGLDPDDVGDDLRLVSDHCGVTYSQTIEKIHQDHHWNLKCIDSKNPISISNISN